MRSRTSSPASDSAFSISIQLDIDAFITLDNTEISNQCCPQPEVSTVGQVRNQNAISTSLFHPLQPNNEIVPLMEFNLLFTLQAAHNDIWGDFQLLCESQYRGLTKIISF